MTGINVLLEALASIRDNHGGIVGEQAERALEAFRSSPLAGDEGLVDKVTVAILDVNPHGNEWAYGNDQARAAIRAVDAHLRGEPSPPDGTGRGGR